MDNLEMIYGNQAKGEIEKELNTQKKYAWKQLSQWDTPKAGYYTQCKAVDTWLSHAMCQYLLVELIDTGNGYIRTEPILKDQITPEMLKIAGKL